MRLDFKPHLLDAFVGVSPCPDTCLNCLSPLEQRVPIIDSMNDSVLPLASAPTLAALDPIAINLLIAGFIAVSVFMILIVLIQRPQGGGLSGAFGSGGGSGGAGQTAFGTKTGDMLTYATIAIFILFLVFAVILNFATRPAKPGATTTPVISTPAETTEPVSNAITDTTDAEEQAVEAIDTATETGEAAIDEATEQPVETPANTSDTPTETPSVDD